MPSKNKKSASTCKRCEAVKIDGKRCNNRVSCIKGCSKYCWIHAEKYNKGKSCVDKVIKPTKTIQKAKPAIQKATPTKKMAQKALGTVAPSVVNLLFDYLNATMTGRKASKYGEVDKIFGQNIENYKTFTMTISFSNSIAFNEEILNIPNVPKNYNFIIKLGVGVYTKQQISSLAKSTLYSSPQVELIINKINVRLSGQANPIQLSDLNDLPAAKCKLDYDLHINMQTKALNLQLPKLNPLYYSHIGTFIVNIDGVLSKVTRSALLSVFSKLHENAIVFITGVAPEKDAVAELLEFLRALDKKLKVSLHVRTESTIYSFPREKFTNIIMNDF